jgi:hypothetical protein
MLMEVVIALFWLCVGLAVAAPRVQLVDENAVLKEALAHEMTLVTSAPDIVVRVVKAGKAKKVIATSGDKRIFVKSVKKLTRKSAAQIAKAIAAAERNKVTLVPADIETPLSPTEKLAETAEEDAVDSADAEVDEEEDDPEPEDAPSAHFVPKDGRPALTISAGFASRLRTTAMFGNEGTPPRYEGALAPGAALSLTLFPARFKDTQSIARDFGGYARGAFIVMQSQLENDPSGAISTDYLGSLHAGAIFLHVFGPDDRAIAIGAELGIAWDRVVVSPALPFPSSNYVSPAVNAIVEIPLARRRLMWLTRLGVMPWTFLGAEQTSAFGQQRASFGLNGATGFHASIFKDILYAEAAGVLTYYWQQFAGESASGYTGVEFNEILVGFNVGVGITY